MPSTDDYELRKFLDMIFRWNEKKGEDIGNPDPNKLYLVSNKDPEKRHEFMIGWCQYVKTQSTADLKLWLNLEAKISEYEICSIIRDELELRNNE